MTKFALVRMTFSLLAALLLAGCGADYYRAETTLHPDGSVERAIYQPRVDTPESSQDPKHWERLFCADEVKREDWSGRIRELKPSVAPTEPSTEEEAACYLAAWGRFASADEIPDHYVYPAAEKSSSHETKQSRLERRVEQIDYGFVVEHRWQETLTNTVELNDMHKARRELADWWITLSEEIWQEAYGAEYDFAPLVAWLRDEGTIWFEELTDLLFELGVRKELHGGELFKQRAAEICAGHGLEPLTQEEVTRFADAKIRELVHRKDGMPLDEKTIAEIRGWHFLPGDPDQEEEEQEQEDEQKLSRVDMAAKTIIERKYGGDEGFKERYTQLGSRIVGVHFIHLPPVLFDYSLTMPGTIITTNGTLATENNVRWSFDADESFPLGYVMSCRSLTVREDLQRQLLKNEPLADRASLLRYVDIVSSSEEELRTAISRCAAEESLDPLIEYRKGVMSPPTDMELSDIERYPPVRRLWKLLGLPK